VTDLRDISFLAKPLPFSDVALFKRMEGWNARKVHARGRHFLKINIRTVVLADLRTRICFKIELVESLRNGRF
jgi:hypothetical protein